MRNDARYTRELKTRISMAKENSKEEVFFHQQTELQFKEETSKVLYLGMHDGRTRKKT
jgi:hypothetical protein